MEKLKLEDLEQNKKGLLSILQSPNQGTSQFTIPALQTSPLPAASTEQLNGQYPAKNAFAERFNVPILQKGSNNASYNGFLIPQLKIGEPNKTIQTINKDKSEQNLHKLLGIPKEEHHHEKKSTEESMADLTSFLSSSTIGKTEKNSDEKYTNEINRDQEALQHEDNETESHIIDLTTALSSTVIGVRNAIRKDELKKPRTEAFDIPFIDCDRQDQQLSTNEYCQIDISHEKFQHCLAQPSSFGRILSSRVKRKRLSTADQPEKTTYKNKHHIERFLFDTKSPDDIFVANLSRFTHSK